MTDYRNIAYFCMEVGLTNEIPTYSGGLGVLAGDTISAAADLKLPFVAVTLLHRNGYFKQVLDSGGGQSEEPQRWVVEEHLQEIPERVTVGIEGRNVDVRAWRYQVKAFGGGHSVPVIFLDTDLPTNTEWDRSLTHHLYGGDAHYRFCQEIILGMGGVRMLRAMGYHQIERFHVNEGHAALLLVELLAERLKRVERPAPNDEDVAYIRQRGVFTTHTPVPAGHDRFPMSDVSRVLEPHGLKLLQGLGIATDVLNMTHLALHLAGYVNGVSLRHGEVSQQLFAPHPIDAITNGVHPKTWVCHQFAELYDRYVPQWKGDSFLLREVLNVPYFEVWSAHRRAKTRLFEHVKRETGVNMEPDVFTIGFARRTAAYKRADLLFDDLPRLRRVVSEAGPLQLVYAGKAHPHDHGAKDLIRRVCSARDQLKMDIKLVYLPDYNMDLCRLMTSGVDLWLNTPEPPLEASGTSGMKAAFNAVPSLSVLDGWWVEGCIEGVTGWAIGPDRMSPQENRDRHGTARFLYDKLEYVILPMYYKDTPRYVNIMKHAVAINGTYFSTHRMVQDYVVRGYYPRTAPAR